MRKRRERSLLLRNRIALTMGLVVAVAILAVSGIAWLVTEHNLRGQQDQALLGLLPQPGPLADPGRPPPLPDFSLLCMDPGGPGSMQRLLEGIELLRADGSTCGPSTMDALVTLPGDRTVRASTLRDGTTMSGAPVRILVYPLGQGQTVLLSRSFSDITTALDTLRDALIAASLISIALAGVAGLLLTRAALVPVETLTTTVEHITRTGDLETSVDISGRDETGRLGRAFTAMTAALSDSRRRQRDLVADAAHELRTPLTSLRTNIDLLVRSDESGRALPARHRKKVLASLQSQTSEFGDLVRELVTLAREEYELSRVPVEIDQVIDRAIGRARNRAGDHRFTVEIEPWAVTGDPPALERLLLNLLDNAIKFSPPGSTITLRSAPGWLTVHDQGPGIPAEHRTQVFGRFWRSPQARGMPGSGLGLAIVADTIAAHSGTVAVVDPPNGEGTCIRVELPARSAAGTSS